MAEKQQAHRFRWLTVTCILLLVVGVLIGLHHRLQMAASRMSTSRQQSLPVKLREGRPFTALVMGTDVGALGRETAYAGNTDTMELATVNPQKKTISLMAIPRDTLVKVNTKQGADYVKINAAYAIGGAKLAEKQVSELLNVPVDYYALVNMGTMKKVVNAVGGVEVNNPFAFTYEGHHFKKGRQHLNGNLALKYSRMRYDDPNNDYGRQKRGQQVIQSVIAFFKQHGSVKAANEVMDAVQDGVRTDVPLKQLNYLYFRYHQSLASSQHDHLQGKDAQIGMTDFQIATPAEMIRTSNVVRSSLGIQQIHHLHNAETRLYHEQTTWNGRDQLAFTLPHGAEYNVPSKEH